MSTTGTTSIFPETSITVAEDYGCCSACNSGLSPSPCVAYFTDNNGTFALTGTTWCSLSGTGVAIKQIGSDDSCTDGFGNPHGIISIASGNVTYTINVDWISPNFNLGIGWASTWGPTACPPDAPNQAAFCTTYAGCPANGFSSADFIFNPGTQVTDSEHTCDFESISVTWTTYEESYGSFVPPDAPLITGNLILTS